MMEWLLLEKLKEAEEKIEHLEKVVQELSDAQMKGEIYHTVEMDMDR
jgi:hypothetical protein